jgi:hypothetical protein
VTTTLAYILAALAVLALWPVWVLLSAVVASLLAVAVCKEKGLK